MKGKISSSNDVTNTYWMATAAHPRGYIHRLMAQHDFRLGWLERISYFR
jgi:hypothetical protein